MVDPNPVSHRLTDQAPPTVLVDGEPRAPSMAHQTVDAIV